MQNRHGADGVDEAQADCSSDSGRAQEQHLIAQLEEARRDAAVKEQLRKKEAQARQQLEARLQPAEEQVAALSQVIQGRRASNREASCQAKSEDDGNRGAEQRAMKAEQEAREAKEHLARLKAYIGNGGHFEQAAFPRGQGVLKRDAAAQCEEPEKAVQSQKEVGNESYENSASYAERAEALEALVRVQEREMEQAAQDEADMCEFMDRNRAERSRACARLLAAWRQEVFKQLVQSSSEREARRNLEAKLASEQKARHRSETWFSSRVEEAKQRASAEMATSQEERKRSAAMERELCDVRRQIERKDELARSWKQAATSIAFTAQEKLAAVEKAARNVATARARIEAYSKRVHFAASRLCHATSLLARRQAAKPPEREKAVPAECAEGQGEAQQALEKEVASMHKERAELVDRLRREESRRKAAEGAKEEAEREKDELATELERARRERDEEARKAEENAAHRIQEAEREAEEEVKEAKREADEAKRESARKAVAGKHAEQELERLKEEKARAEQEKREFYDEKIRSLEKQVRTLQHERNSLMATLRSSKLGTGRPDGESEPSGSSEGQGHAHQGVEEGSEPNWRRAPAASLAHRVEAMRRKTLDALDDDDDDD